MNRPAAALAVLAAAAALGCASIPRPTEADANRAAERWPGESLAALNAGRTRYVAKCSGCHALKAPARRSEARWTETVDKMAERAKLTPDDREAILRYLVTLATRPAAP